MSYYYHYYLGYIKDNKIYPWGLFSADGKLSPVLSKSRSFASNLHDFFNIAKKDQISDELRKYFEYKNWNEEIVMDTIKYLAVEDLPSGSFIKTGYFLIEDVKKYEETHDNTELFFETITPIIYAEMLKNELIFGTPSLATDEEINRDIYPKYSASDYMFYAYPDYDSAEYESTILQKVMESMRDYSMKDITWIIIETEG